MGPGGQPASLERGIQTLRPQVCSRSRAEMGLQGLARRASWRNARALPAAGSGGACHALGKGHFLKVTL